MSETVDVQQYFQEQAGQFDRIYEGKGLLLRWLDRRFRSSIFVRYALTFEHAGDGWHQEDSLRRIGPFSV